MSETAINNEQLLEENQLLRKNLMIRNEILQSLYRRAAMLGNTGEINTSPMNRDFDQQFGYPEVIDKAMYKKLFDRNGVAHWVVALQPSECWLNPPHIYDQEVPSNSPFEVACNELFTKYSCFSVLKRIDVLSGVGNYGVLLFGIDDGKELNEPIDGVEEMPEKMVQGQYNLLFLRPFQHYQVQISKTEWEGWTEIFGQKTVLNKL